VTVRLSALVRTVAVLGWGEGCNPGEYIFESVSEHCDSILANLEPAGVLLQLSFAF
jgi:hypothetical protein